MSPSAARFFFAVAALSAAALPLRATDYYLDPVAGSGANPGTRAAPWGSLAEVAASDRTFAAGDTLILLAGHHGSPALRNVNPGMVVVRPDSGARVTLGRLILQSARFWTVTGLEICADGVPSPKRVPLVKLVGGSDNVVSDCLVYTVLDTSGWSAVDWDTRTCNGMEISGSHQLVENNHIFNVNFGLSVAWGAPSNTVRGNLIEDFSGDGIRGVGDFGLIEGNVVRNLQKVNKNHPDAFQSWSQTPEGVGRGIVRGVVVRGNFFVSYEDKNQRNRGSLNGIGCFDGFFEDWLVENNAILTNSHHGIAFYGARNCRIVNNTVVDLDPTDKGRPWIMIANHKKGRPSSGNLVRNNISPVLSLKPGSAEADHNVKIASSRGFFVNWETGDLRLAAGSKAIGAGTPEGAPTTDITGANRAGPDHHAWDAGAFAFAPGGHPATSRDPAWKPRLVVPPRPQTPPPSGPPPPEPPETAATPPPAKPAP